MQAVVAPETVHYLSRVADAVQPEAHAQAVLAALCEEAAVAHQHADRAALQRRPQGATQPRERVRFSLD